jgi:hypothetical protein
VTNNNNNKKKKKKTKKNKNRSGLQHKFSGMCQLTSLALTLLPTCLSHIIYTVSVSTSLSSLFTLIFLFVLLEGLFDFRHLIFPLFWPAQKKITEVL